ncbi:prostasin-like [Paramacrobiotus metropolitanus]|uniref:prostasin-like n=1 Tax=Paramacrobiotus metropolitanus TaxID=2943436 RepID=UPI00244650D6|nr:prostasin-like [Paramacrobiotus metropolitanus]
MPRNRFTVPAEVYERNVIQVPASASPSDEVIIISPTPQNPPSAQRVAYWIQGNGRPIQINKKAFSLAPSTKSKKCPTEYLAIWDLRYPYYVKQLSCQDGPEFPFYSYSDSVMMLFVSDQTDGTGSFSGFQLAVSELVPGIKLRRPDCPNGEDEICTTKCGIASVTSTEQNRIVGGTEAVPHACPWHVKIVVKGFQCGGSLVAPGWIVTAAHCCVPRNRTLKSTHDPGDVSVRLGFHSCKDPSDGTNVDVAKIFVPSSYRETRLGVNYDYCLLKLQQTVDFAPTIQPICLPRPFSGPVAGEKCTATGCGNSVQMSGAESTPPPVIQPDNLMAVNLTVLDSNQCYQQYFGGLTPELLCTLEKDKDTCQGDSGGPLACSGPDKKSNQFQLSGIVSFGRGCAWNTPGYFADGRRLLPFLIESVYTEGKWGWHADTSVPPIDGLSLRAMPYTPRVIPNRAYMAAPPSTAVYLAVPVVLLMRPVICGCGRC